MIYDPNNPLHRGMAKKRFESLMGGTVPFELTAKGLSRSLSQNSYLHYAIAYLGLQIGERPEYCKERYFKRAANGDLFVREHTDRLTGERDTLLRSTAELTKDEMSMAIDRFLTWAAQTADVVIPSPDDLRAVEFMRMEVENARRWT